MATFGPRFGEDDLGTLSIEERARGLVEVFFQPSATRLKIAHREGDPTTRVLLIKFEARTDTTTLYPVNTMPTSASFLAPKPGESLQVNADFWRMSFPDSWGLGLRVFGGP